MPAVLMSALRTGAQALVGWLVTWLAARGLAVPVDAQHWVVDAVLVAGGIAAWTAIVRWLETRTGDGAAARMARWVARVLMLGTGGTQPVYAPAEEVRRAG